MAAVLLAPEFRWECPNCDKQIATRRPEMPLHPCRGLRGLSAPMVTAGAKAKTEAMDREDWVGNDLVQRDGEGRVVMAVQTTRDDGIDCAVMAPTAGANVR